ncbi:BTAD domain-containing putative transcriptional regulator [Actinokineospora sp. 24-640]
MLIRLTGLVAVEEAGRPPRPLSSAQTQVAFARLVLERATGTDRNRLADTVWPEGLPDTWASALRSVVSRVRTLLPGPLTSAGGRYVLTLPDDAEVDLEIAERSLRRARAALAAGEHAGARAAATEAIGYLREPFLPQHEGEWVAGVREHVEALLLSALETACAAAAALGENRDAVRFAEEAVRLVPLSESAHRCLMSAHAAGGNRADALRAYQRLRQVLSDELGIDPSPETQAAYVELLGGSGEPRTGAAAVRVPFVGRRAELAALAAAWARAESGAGGLVLVAGERGAGRTRLVTEAARRIGRDGGLVMYAHCSGEGVRPVVRALADFAAATPPDALSPRARRVLADVVARRPGDDSDGAVAELLVELAQQPLCLVLDDLDAAEGADNAMVGAVVGLVRRVLARSGVRMLVMATSGPRGVRELDRPERVVLGGLDESDVRALARHLAPGVGHVPPAYRLRADTAGNAVLVVELLRWYREGPGDRPLPAGVHDHADALLGGLAPEPCALLRAAAVAGPVFAADLVAETAELTGAAAMDTLDLLVAAGLLTEVPGSSPKYRYTHDVVRRAVLERLSHTRRRWLHGRLADALEHRRADDPARHSRALARHRAGGASPDGDTRAVQAGWYAAAWATREGSPTEAVRLLEQALAHVPATDAALRADALTRLGLAQADAGRHDCDQTLLDGTIQALHTGRLATAAQAALGLADAVRTRPRLRSEAAAMIDLLLRRMGQGASAVDDVTVGRLLAHQSLLGTRITADDTVRRAMCAMSRELRLLEGPDHTRWRASLAGEALAVAEAVGDTTGRVVAAHHLAAAAELTGDLSTRDTALAALAAAVADGTGVEVTVGDILLLEHAVAVAITRGRLADPATSARPTPVPPEVAAVLTHSSPPGALSARQRLVARWLSGDRPTEEPLEGIDRALSAILRGDRGAAHLTVRASAIGADPLPAGDEWAHAVGVLALCAVELGDATTAAAVASLLTPYAELTCGTGYRSFVGTAAFHLGRLSVVTGDWDGAERYLSAAIAQLSTRRARPWIAVAQQSLAEALVNRGRMGDLRAAAALRTEATWTLSSLGLRHCA